MNGVGFGSGVGNADADVDVGRIVFGIVDLDVPVTVFVEDPGVHQFVFGLASVTLRIGFDQVAVGKLTLRVVVPPAQPRVRRGRVSVPVVLLDVLTMVALMP